MEKQGAESSEMVEKKYSYLLIRASEEGNPVTFLDKEGFKKLLEDPGFYGITRFITHEEFEGGDRTLFSDSDTWFKNPAYWKHDVAMLVKLEILELKPKTVVTEWVITLEEGLHRL